MLPILKGHPLKFSMNLLYNAGIYLYGVLIGLFAPFNRKARLWKAGRKDWQHTLRMKLTEGKWIWFHCASLGEFEQGRNLIEAISRQGSDYKLLLSFFSPSGYEIRKNYNLADCVIYLPLDTPGNARAFLDLVRPCLVVFVKYELWINILSEAHRRSIPTILISARVGKDSRFLKGMPAGSYKEIFTGFKAIFTQDQDTVDVLRNFAPEAHIFLSGDTRYDRVAETKRTFLPLPEIERFKRNRLCLVAGSTWPADEKALFHAWEKWQARFPDFCMILAPHEIHKAHIQTYIDQFPGISCAYSQIDKIDEKTRLLWIDNIGMLSRLYHYADIAYVGGAWDKGLHNILEPTVFACPVIFGPKHAKYPEAEALIEAGGGFSIQSADSLMEIVENLLLKPELRAEIARRNKAFIGEREGATAKILAWLQQERYI